MSGCKSWWSRSPTPSPAHRRRRGSASAPRPTLLDFFVLLVGCALSYYFIGLSTLTVEPRADAPAELIPYIPKYLPYLLTLPQGILLFWPLFYGTQRLLGRRQGLTAG